MTKACDELIHRFMSNPNVLAPLSNEDANMLMEYNYEQQLTRQINGIYYTHDIKQQQLGLMDEIYPLNYVGAIMYLKNLE